jgi:hypothetical protein
MAFSTCHTPLKSEAAVAVPLAISPASTPDHIHCIIIIDPVIVVAMR